MSRYIIIVTTIIAIVSLYPRSSFKYDFDLGKPWKYSNLYAPFTFTIKKNADSIRLEQARLRESFEPFYYYDSLVVRQAKQQFWLAYDSAYWQMPRHTRLSMRDADSVQYAHIAAKLLDTIYNRGIIHLEEDHKKSETLKKIRIRYDRTKPQAEVQPIALFFSNIPNAGSYVAEYLGTNADSAALFLLPAFYKSLSANILYDGETSNRYFEQQKAKIISTNGVVQQGQVIVAQGAIVNAERYQILQSLKEAYESQSKGSPVDFLSSYITDFGYFLVTSVVIFMLVFFIQQVQPRVYYRNRELLFVLLSVFLFLVVVQKVALAKQIDASNVSLYILPYCIVPIIVQSFMGYALAAYVHLSIVLMSGFIVSLGYEYLFLQFVAGLIAVILNRKTYYWSHFFKVTGGIFITYVIAYVGISLIRQQSFAVIDLTDIGWLGVNALITLPAYLFVPMVEKLFGRASNLTLTELSDLNHPLLKHLFNTAPGTFKHSLQVASLAEAAAAEIGANSLLAKVGSLYHDIGKTIQPAYFVENQRSALNPHDDLPYEESARIIIEHVQLGINLAKKYKLPNAIIDFIRTHHGNTRTEYFYRKYMQQHPEREADEKLFRYPGPLPFSRETAILMLADSVEATSRTLQNPTEDEINQLVDTVIGYKINNHQFINCDISFKDLSRISKVFKKQLLSFYHIRISYPVEPNIANTETSAHKA